MSVADGINRFSRRLFWYAVAPALAVFVMFIAIQDLEPALRAVRGDGTPGTFTAVREQCGRRGCSWYGTFESDEGSLRRLNMRLEADPGGLKVGSKVRALDVGSRVEVIGTGFQVDWFLVPLLLMGSLIALAAWAYTVWRRLRRRMSGANAA